MRPMTALVVVLTVVVALLAVLVAGLLRSHAEILRALHDIGVDVDPSSDDSDRARLAPVPQPPRGARTSSDVVGSTPDDAAVSIAVAGAEHDTLLAFLTSGCLTCAGFWSSFTEGDGSVDIPGDARLVIVTKGARDESPAKIRRLAPSRATVVMSSAAWEAYDVPVAPYFVYVHGPSGEIVGEGAAAGWDQVRSLLRQALDDAGLSGDGDRPRPRPRGDAAREARADRDLLAAGLYPGHPSLYPRTEDDLQQRSDRE
jgi:hypothetical protein